MDEAAVHSQEWITEQLGTLLALAPQLECPPSRTRIHAVLQHFCQQVSQGRFKAFARELGVPWSTVATWFGRREIPQLETLLRLCTMWGVSLKECLLDELTTLCYLPGLQAPKIKRDKQHRKAPENANTPHIRHTLQMILASDEEPPPSLQKVARQLRISPYYLRKYHLELCNAITARYRVYIQRHREALMKQQCEEVCQMAHQLIDQGERPTRKKLEEILSKPGILRSPEIRQAWETVLREFDGET